MTATGFTVIFVATSLGSALVLFFKKDISPKVNTAFLGFASGVMIAASVWSLIIPSIEASENYGKWSFLPAAVGFVIGGFFLVLLDHAVPHLHRGTACEEGPHTKRLKNPRKCFSPSPFTIYPKAWRWALRSARRRVENRAAISSQTAQKHLHSYCNACFPCCNQGRNGRQRRSRTQRCVHPQMRTYEQRGTSCESAISHGA